LRPPAISDTRNSTSATTNTILAMLTAAPAIPPKPRAAAINAIINNVTTRFSVEVLRLSVVAV